MALHESSAREQYNSSMGVSRAESEFLLYGGANPQEKPRYTIAQAARYLHISPTTLRSWVRGRHYPRTDGPGRSEPLIQAGERLSFSNLVEAHVLRALRVDHKVEMSAVREALDYAQKAFRIKRLLLSRELLAAPGNVFLERYGQLVNLGRSGQLAVRQLLEAHLRRVEWDLSGLPVRLFPASSEDLDALEAQKIIVIDPRIAFGRPIIASRAIRTSAIVSRIDAGESPSLVAEDYKLAPYEVEAAIVYERLPESVLSARPARPKDVSVPDWQRKLVCERLAAHERGEGATIPWGTVRQDAEDFLRKECPELQRIWKAIGRGITCGCSYDGCLWEDRGLRRCEEPWSYVRLRTVIREGHQASSR